MNEQTKLVIDISSLAVVGGTLLAYLPAIAALFSIVWSCLRIYEWFKKRRNEWR